MYYLYSSSRNKYKNCCLKTKYNINTNEKKAIKFLYQYRTLNEFTLPNLKNQELRLNSPTLFNDPYDCRLLINDDEIIDEFKTFIDKKNVSIEEKKLIREASESNEYKEIIEDLVNKSEKIVFDAMIDMVSIACFTEEYKSMLMWSHYSDYHKGICIKYKKEDLNSISEITLDKVIYTDKRNYNIIDLIDNVVNTEGNEKIVAVNDFIQKSIFLKSKCWKYEKEWRMLYLKSNNDNEKDREGFNIKSPKPEAIYMGTKIKEEDRDLIINLCREKEIELYQMKMRKDKVELVEEIVQL